MIDPTSNSGYAYAADGYPRAAHNRRPADEKATPEDRFSQKEASARGEKTGKDQFTNPQQLDKAEQKQVEELKKRDAEVRTHERAHMAAAGNLAIGGPNYVFQTGPDGRQYAIGGSVKIDTSPGNTPEETARKAQQIRAAAHAPADPSGQDLKVAAAAASMEKDAASKSGEKAEKDAEKAGAAAKPNPTVPDGAVTTARQVFAASPDTLRDGDQTEEGHPPAYNVYLMQAAKRYQQHA